ncbi:hypothetical protein I553_2725 [Mycobacterium xenopi 4042]|uniref:Uncharacterized protein n=1 Tax=Mycobacterium xenopi 4042 TaxID=1299334 RepID=X8CLS0_MYCXE|nr:hypothetical protein I553_2725 [Mycobacterium xenopi 4042]
MGSGDVDQVAGLAFGGELLGVADMCGAIESLLSVAEFTATPTACMATLVGRIRCRGGCGRRPGRWRADVPPSGIVRRLRCWRRGRAESPAAARWSHEGDQAVIAAADDGFVSLGCLG